jgi:hypothetical protein
MIDSKVCCAGCGQPVFQEDEHSLVGTGYWHQRCLTDHALRTLVELTTAPRGLWTAEQVAARLGESASSVRRRKDAIGYVRLRRAGVPDEDAPIRFRPEDVERYILENHEQPQVEEGEEARSSRVRPRTPIVEQHPHLRPRRERAG